MRTANDIRLTTISASISLGVDQHLEMNEEAAWVFDLGPDRPIKPSQSHPEKPY